MPVKEAIKIEQIKLIEMIINKRNNANNSPSEKGLLLLTIFFEQEDLSVILESEGKETKRLFSYCINREDVENAILQGP